MLFLQLDHFGQVGGEHLLVAAHHRIASRESTLDDGIGGLGIVDELDDEVDTRVSKDVVGLVGKFQLGRLLLVLGHISHTHLHEVHIVGVDFLEHVVQALAHGAKSK